MKFIIDANIVIAMLLKPGKTAELFFLDGMELYAPNLLFEELDQKKEVIVGRSSISEIELKKFFKILQEKINVIPEDEFKSRIKLADSFCPDPNDVSYFALALHLNYPIWSNDKELKNQNKVKVYSTHELVTLLE
ncbi:MAG: PIN domain-containing protein [Nanoarchaeota archaeon]